MNIVTELIGGVAGPVVTYLNKRTERKQAQDAIKGQVALAKEKGDQQVNVDVGKWELASKEQETGTWKDEYVTVSVMSIFNGVVLFSVGAALGMEKAGLALTGLLDAVGTLTEMGVPVGTLMAFTVGAALSIKGINSLR